MFPRFLIALGFVAGQDADLGVEGFHVGKRDHDKTENRKYGSHYDSNGREDNLREYFIDGTDLFLILYEEEERDEQDGKDVEGWGPNDEPTISIIVLIDRNALNNSIVVQAKALR